MSEYYEKQPYAARITWLGFVADRKAALASAPFDAVNVSFAGIEGEAHGGVTRPACSRVAALHPRNTEIRNVRQLTVLSEENLDQLARNMGLAQFDPAWIGASIVVSGIPDFSFLPPTSRLQTPDGTTLVVEMVNYPCTLSGKSVEAYQPGFGARFKPAAMELRGITAYVEREGRLALGDPVTLFTPKQRGWQPGVT